MNGYMAVLGVAALPMSLLITIAPHLDRWAVRRQDARDARESADAQAATEWLSRLASEGDDFPQTIAAPGVESLTDYITRIYPDARSAA